MSYDTLVTLFAALSTVLLSVSIFAFPLLGLVLVWFRWFKYRFFASHPRLELIWNILFTLFALGFLVSVITSLVHSIPSILNS